jgi:hypothetical protein
VPRSHITTMVASKLSERGIAIENIPVRFCLENRGPVGRSSPAEDLMGTSFDGFLIWICLSRYSQHTETRCEINAKINL